MESSLSSHSTYLLKAVNMKAFSAVVDASYRESLAPSKER